MEQEGNTKRSKTNLYFILGISMLPIGIATNNPAFIGVGTVFLLMGASGRGIENSTKLTLLQKTKRKKIVHLISFVLLVIFLIIILYSILQKYQLI